MNTCFTAIDSLLISWLIFKHLRSVYTWLLGVHTRLSLSHTIIAFIAPPNLQWSPYFLVYGWDFWWLLVIFPMSSHTISYIYIIMKLNGLTQSFSLTRGDLGHSIYLECLIKIHSSGHFIGHPWETSIFQGVSLITMFGNGLSSEMELYSVHCNIGTFVKHCFS